MSLYVQMYAHALLFPKRSKNEETCIIIMFLHLALETITNHTQFLILKHFWSYSYMSFVKNKFRYILKQQ